MTSDSIEISNLQPIRVLAITRARLQAVEAAYQQDPAALTDDVLEDAFRYGAPRGVLRYLVEKKGLDEQEISDLMAKIFLEEIPAIQSNHLLSNGLKETELILDNLSELAQTFPEGLVGEPDCPLNIVLFSTVFPRSLLVWMIKSIPEKATFVLPSNDLLPTNHEAFRSTMRTSQSSLWMKAIGVLLENVDHFHIDRPEMTNDEITRLLTMLCRSTNSTDRVSFGPKFLQKIANTGSLEEIVAPANQELEDAGRKSPIEEVYLEYNSTPDFGIHALLLQMKSLTRLDIKVSQPFKATKEMCESLCVLLMQGSVVELNLQAATEEEGLFLPLLDAANQSDHLCDLRLQDLGNQAEVEIYQDEILRILENNTDLDLALVCQDIRTMVDETNYLADETNYLAMKAHVNKECFLDRTESDNKQRLIDYKTLLNLCGRRETMEETIQLEDFVGCLCGEAIGDWIVHFLEDVTGESKEELITILQYGLLRQQPATWLPQDTKGSRKRKATGPPENLAVHKTKLLSSK